MRNDELLGGALFHLDDLDKGESNLARVLLDHSIPDATIRTLNLDPELVHALRDQLPVDPMTIAIGCASAAAWVRGRRSVTVAEAWEPVVSMGGQARVPIGVRRTTAETISGLITSARVRIRFVAPFFDITGATFLGEPLAAATSRGVEVELYLPPDVGAKEPALRTLVRAVKATGELAGLSVFAATESQPWPHLKVMVVDSRCAYVGSANMTGPALQSGNLEFGVLVKGPDVAAIDRVIDLIPAVARLNLER